MSLTEGNYIYVERWRGGGGREARYVLRVNVLKRRVRTAQGRAKSNRSSIIFCHLLDFRQNADSKENIKNIEKFSHRKTTYSRQNVRS
jgi:hypothetical protein